MEGKILLKDILDFDDKEISRVKIKFNNWTGENPVETYLREPELLNSFNLFWRNQRRYYNIDDIAVNLVQMSYDTWLLTTIKEVTKELGVTFGQNYEGRELIKYSGLYGRLIVRCKRPSRAPVFHFKNIMEKIEVFQILPDVYGGDDFPGYDNISLSYHQLETILRFKKKDWITALSNQKAVYLLTDKQNGKLYVGSATGDNGMLLQRWQSYIDSIHGNNKELKELVSHEGVEYIKENCQYAVLENYNGKVDDSFVLKRESWWKNLLKSREFGYNAN